MMSPYITYRFWILYLQWFLCSCWLPFNGHCENAAWKSLKLGLFFRGILTRYFNLFTWNVNANTKFYIWLKFWLVGMWNLFLLSRYPHIPNEILNLIILISSIINIQHNNFVESCFYSTPNSLGVPFIFPPFPLTIQTNLALLSSLIFADKRFFENN